MNGNRYQENYNYSASGVQKEVSNYSTSVPEPPLYLVISLTILYTLIFVIGIVGNVLVTLVVLKGRSLRTSVNYFLISLCVADLLVIIVCMPTAWVDIYSQDVWYFGEAMCKLVPYLENVVAGASVLTILFISVERYKAICQPLHKSDKAVVRVFKHVTIIWIVCSLSSLPFAVLPVYRDSIWMDGTPIKVCRHPMKYPWQKLYLTAVPVIFFVLPFVILAVLYCRVGRVLIPKACNSSDMYDDTYREKMRQRRQGINIVICIVLVFFVSHLPYRVVCLWHLFEQKDVIINLGLENYLSIVYSARIAFYLNHALNPILYNFVSRKFRAELRWIIHTSFCRKPECIKSRREFGTQSYRSCYPPTVKFKKPENASVAIVPPCRPSGRADSSSSEQRKFRNDFSVLYASLHVDDKKSERLDSAQDVKDIKKHFSGQINCEGEKKQITSFRVFIRSTAEGFAINVDLEAKSGKCKTTTRETCRTTCL